jgi:YHS domain-containing protein
MIALSFGCSKKKEEAPKPEAAQTTEAAQQPVRTDGYRIAATFDPVSKEEVDPQTSPYTYGYNGVGYYFTSAENLEAFKADPAKYVTSAETPQAAPSQGQ